MKQRITQNAFDLIIRFEVGGGPTYYNRFLKHPTWPEGSSGVTIGFGYDLGYEQHFEADWGQYLNSDNMDRLSRCLGKTGSRAHQAVSGVRDIEIPWDMAAEIFNEGTLPHEIRNKLRAFPG